MSLLGAIGAAKSCSQSWRMEADRRSALDHLYEQIKATDSNRFCER